jgi:hypothetical protein
MAIPPEMRAGGRGPGSFDVKGSDYVPLITRLHSARRSVRAIFGRTTAWLKSLFDAVTAHH